MAKKTYTKYRRQFDLAHNGDPEAMTKDGRVALLTPIKRDEPLPAEPRIPRQINCGGEIVTIMVSEGQLINERKVCKRFYENRGN